MPAGIAEVVLSSWAALQPCCRLQGLDFFGGTVPDERALLSWEAAHASDRIVLLSDVWLDHPEILDRLHTVFAGGARPLACWLRCQAQALPCTECRTSEVVGGQLRTWRAVGVA